MNKMAKVGDRPAVSNVIVRLVLYYTGWIVLLTVLFRLVPAIPQYVSEERERHIQSIGGFEAAAPDIPGFEITGVTAMFNPRLVVPLGMGMIVSFALALPIAWVYLWTHARKRSVQGFARTLVVVPLAIAVVVFLVKGSLALAFSLAGIVAAVRFRSALEEPSDAVYMFIVIAIGLAAGVQLLVIAALGSMFFLAAELLVWRTNILRGDLLMVGWHLEKVAPLELKEAGLGEDRRDVVLRIHMTNVAGAMTVVEPLLETRTSRWDQTEEASSEPGVSVVRFDLRLKKKAKLEALAQEIRAAAGEHVTRVEI